MLLAHHGIASSKCGRFMVPVVSEQPDVTLEGSLKWSVYRKIQDSNVICSKNLSPKGRDLYKFTSVIY